MSSLRQILTEHAPLLVIDACSARVQAGWLNSVEDFRWAESTEESGIGIFRCVEELKVVPRDVGAFIFCDGPGSLLGIRTAAMAIRTWCVLSPRPIFSYHSLELVAHFEGRPELSVIADARRDTWHSVSMSTALSRVPTDQLAGRLAMPQGFRNWSKLPAEVETVSYNLAELLPHTMEVDLYHPKSEPEAFLHEEPSYVTWTPHIHRAP